MKKERALYFECATGISGDMTVAALLDLGADYDYLTKKLHSLPLSGYAIEVKEVLVSDLRALKFNVNLECDAPVNAYLPDGQETARSAAGQGSGLNIARSAVGQGLAEQKKRTLAGDKPERRDHCHSESRGLAEISEIIRGGSLNPAEVKLALEIFSIIAQAEASVHALSLEDIHFHEVGAVDSIIDVCAAAICLSNLQISNFYFPPLPVGRGFSACHHGLMPIPVPAVAKIGELYGLSFRPTDIEAELVTPTGAGIVAALRTAEQLPESCRLIRSGSGAGTRALPLPNLLRVFEVEYDC